MPVYVLVVGASIALFFVWGGWLWSARRDSAMVWRFAVSYLAVIPLAVAALLASRTWSWSHLVGTAGSAWAIKILVTATVYQTLIHDTPTQRAQGPIREHAAPLGPDACTDSDPVKHTVELEFTAGGLPDAPLTLRVGDLLHVTNRDGRLHTAQLLDAQGGIVANSPLPPGGRGTTLSPEDPGEHRLRCAAHPGETALVHVDAPPCNPHAALAPETEER